MIEIKNLTKQFSGRGGGRHLFGKLILLDLLTRGGC